MCPAGNWGGFEGLATAVSGQDPPRGGYPVSRWRKKQEPQYMGVSPLKCDPKGLALCGKLQLIICSKDFYQNIIINFLFKTCLCFPYLRCFSSGRTQSRQAEKSKIYPCLLESSVRPHFNRLEIKTVDHLLQCAGFNLTAYNNDVYDNNNRTTV